MWGRMAQVTYFMSGDAYYVKDDVEKFAPFHKVFTVDDKDTVVEDFNYLVEELANQIQNELGSSRPNIVVKQFNTVTKQ